MWHQAAQALCLGVVEALVAAGADGRALHVGRTALELAREAGATAPKALQDELQEKVAAIVEAASDDSETTKASTSSRSRSEGTRSRSKAAQRRYASMEIATARRPDASAYSPEPQRGI